MYNTYSETSLCNLTLNLARSITLMMWMDYQGNYIQVIAKTVRIII